jgi:hypothetical protein
MSWESIKEQILGMINHEKIEHKNFRKNLTVDLLYKYFNKEENNKTLYKINNFLIKSHEEFVISSRCIINNKKIIKPARTIFCNHIECLDLETLFNTILNLGQCPLCQPTIKNKMTNKKLGVDSIYIDDYLYEIYHKFFQNTIDNSYEYLILNKFTKKVRLYDPRVSQEKLDILMEGDPQEKNFDYDLDKFNKIVGADENQINLKKLIK